MTDDSKDHYLFPNWANWLLPAAVILIVGAGIYLPFLAALLGSPTTTDVGYAPKQPIPFSHALHVGDLGMDCRYCHSTVHEAAHAALPTSQTCMNCHASVKADSPYIAKLRESYETGVPIEWQRVHDLPDHVYFNHAAHVNAGVGCNTCHGQVDKMEVVYQHQALSMAWCLQCHREPEKFLRPADQVTNMNWDPHAATGMSQTELGPRLVEQHRIHHRHVMESCSKCHR